MPQKTGIRFSSKKFLHKCLFKIPLWHEIDNTTSYFLISSKNMKWKQHFHIDTFWSYLLLNMAVFWGLNIKEGMRQRRGALMSNHFLIGHRWYDMEKLTVPGSSNLKAQHKVLCYRDERKISKIIGGGWLFRGKCRSLLSKLMFTHSAFCWSRSHGAVEI